MSTLVKPDNLDAIADQAFEAYAAMVRAETPELSVNSFWAALRDTAYARFRNHFERCSRHGG